MFLDLTPAGRESRKGFTATERARSYRYMLDSGAFASEADLAAALGINKSNVNRTLDVLELPEELTSRIIDTHAISSRQASRFMPAWRDPNHQALLAPRFAISYPVPLPDLQAAARGHQPT